MSLNLDDMPVPVPPGRFGEYAAAISEGFCPQCRRPFTSEISGLSVVLARCDRDTCRCCWELDIKPVVPVIRWNGPGATPQTWWDIYTMGENPPFPGHPS